ncbi:MAG: hypothetical protein JMDDDDMK_03935 [Acidobacteria bacterium]|nr:hypothetical protein [Acidobacteriota bacterium]
MRFTSGRFTLPAIILLGCALLAASVYGLLHSLGRSDKNHPSSISRSNSQFRYGTASGSGAVASGTTAGKVASSPQRAISNRLEDEEEEERRERERYDQPGEAAEFYRQKRLAEGETELPVEKYVAAMERMRDLPVYSTRSKQMFSSRREMLNSAQSFGAASPDLLNNWTPLGPGNVGGRTRALLIHPANPDVIYAAAAAGGVWKSMDGGKSWKPLGDLLPNIAVNALAMDPQNPEVIYAGTGEGYFNSDAVRGAGVFRSFDGGATWRRLDGTGTADFYYVNDIVISPAKSNRIYAATRSGVMRSLDGGSTWTKVLDPDRLNGGCLDLAIRTDKTKDYVLAACGTATGSSAPASVQSAIYLNTEAEQGLSGWEVVYSETGMGRTSLAIAPSNQNVVYAVSAENGAAGTPHSLHAVFRSASGGVAGSWTAQVRGADASTKKLNTLLFTNPIFALNAECYGRQAQFFNQGWYNNVIAVDPKDENIVWVGGVDLFRSEDGGMNWGMASFWHLPQTNSHYVHADHHAIAFHPYFDGAVNRTMYVGNDGGIYRTDDARAQTVAGDRAACSSDSSHVSWLSLNNGYAVTQFYHGVPLPNGATYIGGAQDNGVLMGSDDGGPNGWKEIVSGDGGYVAVDWTNPKIIYAATTWLSLKKSTDGGLKFNAATTGVSNSGFTFISPFAMDPSDPARLWMGGRQMWRTRNGAANWSQASADLAGSTTAIAIAPTDSNFVLAGVSGGQIHRTTIGLNSDADTLWPYAKPRTGYVSGLAFDPSNRDVAYATYSTFGGKHVWRSLDGGVSWQAIDGAGAGALPDIPAHCIVVDPTNTQRLYLGTDLGVFVSIDGGASWAVENTGFANVPVESLSLNVVGYTTQLFAFTHGRGVWRVTLGGPCSNALSPLNQTINVEGGKGSVNVASSGDSCQWAAESNSNWITITSDSAGRGSGVVTFNVAPNPQGLPRSGAITIAGKSVAITQAGAVVSVSAASLRGGTLAPESIASAFGAGLAATIQLASGAQLPTALANTSVTVKDSAGVERRAPLFFISPNQVNYQMPQGIADGQATVIIANGNDGVFSGSIQIARVAPGLFTASSSGQGPAVGQALRIKAGGAQSAEPLSLWDAAQSRFVANPIDLGAASDQVFLILYGTGWRFRSSLSAVSATIGGIDAPVLFAGAQGSFAGLDQINLQLPRALAGRGEVDLILTVDGQTANTIRISVK